MKKSALSLIGVLACVTPALGTILLNEIHVNPPNDPSTGDDSNYEYVELRSSTGGQEYTTVDGTETGEPLTLLLIDTSGGNIGEIKEAWRLATEVPGENGGPSTFVPFRTGTNGLLLLGNGYDDEPVGGPWNGLIDPATAMADPKTPSVLADQSKWSGMGDNNIDPNGGLNFLIVAGWQGLTPIAGASLGDIDIDNNNVADSTPWTAIVDAVGWTDFTNAPVRTPYSGPGTNVSTRATFPATSAPDSLSRLRNNNTANSRDAWYGGKVSGGVPDAISFTSPFGGITGEATPGRANRNTSVPTPNFLINEVGLNPPGTDGNFEFIEIINKTVDPETGASYASLSGYALLLLNSNSNTDAERGKIVQAYDLGKYSTGSNGLLLLGDNYPTQCPWQDVIDPATHLADPVKPTGSTEFTGLGAGEIGDNNGFTLVLVRNYSAGTAVIGTKITNTGGTAITAGVGVIGTVVDTVGFDEVAVVAGTEVGPINATDGKSAAGGGKVTASITGGTAGQNFYTPDLLARKANVSTAQSAAAWYGGKFGPRNSGWAVGLSNGYFFGGFKGEATPGRANLSAAAPAPTALLLNEIHLNPPSASDATEFVEVSNPAGTITGMNDTWLVIVDAAPPDIGRIRTVLDLRGMSTGPNGIAMFADGVEELSNPWRASGFLSPLTMADDPRSFSNAGVEQLNFNMGTDSLEPNSGLAALLVRGFTGTLDADLDANDDGTFDSQPWTAVYDAISFNGTVDPTVPALTPAFEPGNLSRSVGNTTAKSAAAWFGGELQGPASFLQSTEFTDNWFGSFKGAASPGRVNHSGTPNSAATLVINEVNINPPGGDNDKEFIELLSSTGGSISTNGWTLLLIDSAAPNTTSNTGRIIQALSLDGLHTGSNGLLLLGAGYDTATMPWDGMVNANNVLAPKPAAGTALAAPSGFTPDLLGLDSDNGAFSLLLVKDFNALEGFDIDEGVGPDGSTAAGVANDGVIDAQVWTAPIADAVGFKFWNTNRTDVNDNPLPAALEGRVYGGVDLSQGVPANPVGYTPDSVSRVRGNLTANSAAAWYGGDIAGTSGTSTDYDASQRFPSGYTGRVTPGSPNVRTTADATADSDGDTVANFVEDATAMNPASPDVQKLPAVGSVTVGEAVFPTLSYTRFAGAAVTGGSYTYPGFLYEVQVSADLVTWTTSTQQVSTTPNGDGTETATFRPTDAFATANPGGKLFLRLKITRQ